SAPPSWGWRPGRAGAPSAPPRGSARRPPPCRPPPYRRWQCGAAPRTCRCAAGAARRRPSFPWSCVYLGGHQAGFRGGRIPDLDTLILSRQPAPVQLGPSGRRRARLQLPGPGSRLGRSPFDVGNPAQRGLFMAVQTDFAADTSRFQQRTFLGHPVGLYVLFFTEMWERFSYYGMRALLMLYMVNYYRWREKAARRVYKWYTSLVYLTPILGGFLADRYLGNKRAVIIGAVLMAIGHFLMAFEPYPAFFSALVFLILGNGFFKPNMATQVGRLYPINDPRRDGAYTIYYMGVNLGAFLSPLVCGWLMENTLGEHHSGFTVAGIGMVCGLVIYLLGQPLVREISGTAARPTAALSEDAALFAFRHSLREL